MSETFHQRWMRLSRTRDYAGALALLRTHIPAEHSPSGRQGNTSVAHAPRDTPEPSSPPEDEPSNLSGGWRTDLENTPRDGTEFIVYRDDAGVFAAYWQHPAHEDGGLDWDEEPTLFSSTGYDLTREPPTHWQPHPPPPALPQDHATVRGREGSVDLQTNVEPHCADAQARPTGGE